MRSKRKMKISEVREEGMIRVEEKEEIEEMEINNEITIRIE